MKLTYFNHASIAIEDTYSRFAIITDPWVISDAFGSWEQYPIPNQGAIDAYLQNLDKYALLISHGHDDHCDDRFIRTSLNPCQIFVPKFRSQGFCKRIKNLCKNGSIVTELEHGQTYSVQCFSLMATINPDFTNNDSIIAVRDNKNTVIHANDNWHKQPDSILDLLNNFSLETDITYLAQIGIAGSFPIYYLGLKSTEKHNLIIDQLRLQAECIEINSSSLKATRAFSYANESRFTYLDSSDWYSTNLRQGLNDNHINATSIYRGDLGNAQDFQEGSLEFCNLRNHYSYGFVRAESSDKTLAERSPKLNNIIDCLSALEHQVNSYIHMVGINASVALTLMSYSEMEKTFSAGDLSVVAVRSPVLYLCSTPDIWQKILLGDLNLESITIGGCGLLKKSPSTWNARFVHDAISRFAYRYQAMAKEQHLI
jgi:hypothetical protein